jgi:hypothetical protein
MIVGLTGNDPAREAAGGRTAVSCIPETWATLDIVKCQACRGFQLGVPRDLNMWKT